MKTPLHRLFLDHPREVEESYLEHLGAAGFAFLHALIPGIAKTAASDRIKDMADELTGRARMARETRMREAGAIDPGL
ncbi:MAG: DUF6356 family protein [Brevundimonas sp.]